MIDDKTMNLLVHYMDEDLREKVHYELAPCSNEKFLKRYCELDLSFKNLVKNEFATEIGQLIKDL